MNTDSSPRDTESVYRKNDAEEDHYNEVLDATADHEAGQRFLTVQTSSPSRHGQIAGQESREGADGRPRSTTTQQENPEETASSSPSNERLLGIAFVSFMSFSLTQLFFATRAGSHAMLGDSAAMIVDALTYLFNYIAERRKNNFTSDLTDPKQRQRSKRKLVLQMEIIPPILSVTVLVVVTIVVTGNAIEVLSTPEQAEKIPDLRLMMMFSVFNLVLDMLNVFCFSKSSENLGIRPEFTVKSPTSLENFAESTTDSNRAGYNRVEDTEKDHHESEDDDDDDDLLNLNMCSAFTHVFADTLRSFAVILAAAIGLNVSSVEPDKADAVAAIVVSSLIALSLIPLILGLCKSVAELKAILAEEKSEAMFLQRHDEVELT